MLYNVIYVAYRPYVKEEGVGEFVCVYDSVPTFMFINVLARG